MSRPDATERVQVSDLGLYPFLPVRWSPDGRRIAFSASSETGGWGNPVRLYLAIPEEGSADLLAPEDPSQYQGDPCWSADGKWLAYSASLFGAGPASSVHLQRVDIDTHKVSKLEGSEGLWSPKCARDGRILARDQFAQAAHERALGSARPPGYRQFFKLWDPVTRAWTAFSVDLPGDLQYPTWSRDGRFIYGNIPLTRSVVRFDVKTRRVETVVDIEGLGEASWSWMELDPSGAPLVHRDASQREILVMDWEER